MAPQITSAIISSPTSSLNCIVDIPKPPLSVHTQPSKSSISNSMNNLLPPPLSSYPPMSPSKINHQYIPTDPLYLPRYRPEWPVWEKTFRGREQGHDTSESRHETRHLLTSHYVKIPHYHITRNPSHWTTSLIWRHIMSWRDARGLVEQHGCCGRKSFYCSKLVLLNDDDDDDDETFRGYVKRTKQLSNSLVSNWLII